MQKHVKINSNFPRRPLIKVIPVLSWSNKEEIRFGLTAIKGIRRDFVEDILNERKQNGPFQSVDQFLIRIDKRWLKLELLQSLTAVGVLNESSPNRKQLMLISKEKSKISFTVVEVLTCWESWH